MSDKKSDSDKPFYTIGIFAGRVIENLYEIIKDPKIVIQDKDQIRSNLYSLYHLAYYGVPRSPSLSFCKALDPSKHQDIINTRNTTIKTAIKAACNYLQVLLQSNGSKRFHLRPPIKSYNIADFLKYIRVVYKIHTEDNKNLKEEILNQIFEYNRSFNALKGSVFDCAFDFVNKKLLNLGEIPSESDYETNFFDDDFDNYEDLTPLFNISVFEDDINLLTQNIDEISKALSAQLLIQFDSNTITQEDLIKACLRRSEGDFDAGNELAKIVNNKRGGAKSQKRTLIAIGVAVMGLSSFLHP